MFHAPHKNRIYSALCLWMRIGFLACALSGPQIGIGSPLRGDLFDLMEKCVLTKGCRCGKGMCWDKLGPPYSNTYVLALFYQAMSCWADLNKL